MTPADHLKRDIDRARRHLQAGQLADAESLCRQILISAPDEPDALYLLAQIALITDNANAGVPLLEKALVRRPGHSQSLLLLSKVRASLGDTDQAIEALRKTLELEPKHAEALFDLGGLYQKLGDPLRAVKCYQQILEERPDFAPAYVNMGNAYKQAGDKTEALDCFQKAVTLSPNMAEAHFNLGNAQIEIGHLAEAKASYQKTVQLKPEHWRAQQGLGAVLSAQGLHSQAMAHLKKILDKHPKSAETWDQLGQMQATKGELAEAEKSYRAALSIHNNNADVHFNLAGTLLQRGMTDKALNHYRKATRLDPSKDLYWAGLASALGGLSAADIGPLSGEELLQMLKRKSAPPHRLVRPVLSCLREDPDFCATLSSLDRRDQRPAGIANDTASKLSAFPLFLEILKVSPLYDLEIEIWLTQLRRLVVFENLQGRHAPASLPLLSALALHCFANEYIYTETASETEAVCDLMQSIATSMASPSPSPPDPAAIALLACYRPLSAFDWSRDLEKRDMPSEMQGLVRAMVTEPREEQQLKTRLKRLTPVSGGVSGTVTSQYEENPFPRWIEAGYAPPPRNMAAVLRSPPLGLDVKDDEIADHPRILVAGCGTGQQAVGTARRYLNASVLAIDLSDVSLAYATRKSGEMGLTNLEFAQADILRFDANGETFDLIECVGVLHHLQDPETGWKRLVNLLNERGFMKIGLYSEAARQDVVAGRKMIEESGFPATLEGIRRCREEIVRRAKAGDPLMDKLRKSNDFYNTSNLRDLLFHVQEVRFTLPEIKACLDRLGLMFMGFEIDHLPTRRAFETFAPGEHNFRSLAKWHEFEMQNPETFRGMYQFWCQKRIR